VSSKNFCLRPSLLPPPLPPYRTSILPSSSCLAVRIGEKGQAGQTGPACPYSYSFSIHPSPRTPSVTPYGGQAGRWEKDGETETPCGPCDPPPTALTPAYGPTEDRRGGQVYSLRPYSCPFGHRRSTGEG
jgi:hypothetical protein